MQRSNIFREEPSVPLVSLRDDRVIPKCPLPVLSPTRTMRGDTLRGVGLVAGTGTMKPTLTTTMSGGSKGKGLGLGVASSKTTAGAKKLNYQTINKNFRRSTQSFYSSNARSASVSPSPQKIVKQVKQQIRKSLPPPDLPKLYPDLNITAQQFNDAKALADAHRRQRSRRWSVTSSNSLKLKMQQVQIQMQSEDKATATTEEVLTSSSSPVVEKRKKVDDDSLALLLEQQPEEPQDRGRDIPDHVNVLARRPSDVSNLLDDDESTLSQSPKPSPPPPRTERKRVEGYWAPSTPTTPTQLYQQQPEEESTKSPSTGGGDVEKSPVPSALDKSSLKRLAAQHRRSICANKRGSGGSNSRYSHSSRWGSAAGGGVGGSNINNSSDARSLSMITPPASPQVMRHHHVPQQQQKTPPPPQQQHTAQQAPAATMVEICPGLSVPLRGSDETMKAVANRFYTNVVCYGCWAQIHCIADVQYTICPHCRVISPMEDDCGAFEGERITPRWGLGLGFTTENLWNMQAELAAKSFGSYH